MSINESRTSFTQSIRPTDDTYMQQNYGIEENKSCVWNNFETIVKQFETIVKQFETILKQLKQFYFHKTWYRIYISYIGI